MNINRHTYETIFLMYIDNELNVQERKEVEEFVQHNPDLKIELAMLQQTMLPIDYVMYTDKNSLIKNEPVSELVQQQLLLLLDNELNLLTTTQLLTTIETNEAIGKEWQLLQQTKLDATDTMVFENKELLYKYEQRSVITMRGWKMAAAAILIGVGLWGSIAYYINDLNTSIEITAIITPLLKNNIIPIDINGKPATIIDSASTTNTSIVVVTQQQNIENKKFSKLSKQAIPKQQLNKISIANNVIVKQTITTKNNKVSNNLPAASYLENIDKVERNKTTVASVSTSKQTLPALTIDNATKNDATNTFATSTTFNNNDNNNITYGFDDDEDQPKKSKVGGFLKKINRVLQRKAKIKSGSENRFNVANLSFAIQ